MSRGKTFMTFDTSIRRRLVKIALGNEPAEIVIRNGILIDVYSARVLPHQSVAISDGLIAYVGPDADHTVGDKTRVIEADDRIICPGYIETHTHLANYWNMSDFLEYAIPGGTTTFITETESCGFALGAAGFKAFLEQVRNRPVKVYCLIPPMVTLSPAAERLCISRDEVKELLKDDMVVGLGESYWQGALLASDNRVLELIQETLCAGKSVQGHAAGAFDRKLAAYAAAGALSCHEAISTEDVLARLALGYYVMIREGDIRRDLQLILPVKDMIDLRRVILVTDGSNPSLVVKQGYFVDVVQKAVDLGLEPVKAVQMVTLNPAVHFGLDHITGGISPGRLADILLLTKPGMMKPDLVISSGRIVAENGKAIVPLPRVPYPDALMNTVHINPVSVSELRVPISDNDQNGLVRTIDIQPGGLVTREGKAEPIRRDGEYCANPESDLLKVVFIERVSGNGEKFIGFVRGWGQKEGAVATSLCWDASGVIAIGANENEIATAINRVIQNQGGTTLSVGGDLVVDIPFSVGGYVSEMRIEDIAEGLEHFQKIVTALGSGLNFPLLTLCTLSTAAIPFIRITERGYFRFRENDTAGL
jgi:adenine deaminase